MVRGVAEMSGSNGGIVCARLWQWLDGMQILGMSTHSSTQKSCHCVRSAAGAVREHRKKSGGQ
jgi:hypothetical protein